MKKILVSLAILTISLVASARSIDQTAVVATVTGLESGIKEVALLADGRLQVVSKEGSVHTVQVSKEALNKLEDLAVGLSFQEVKNESRLIVCERMALPTLSNLSVGQFDMQSRTFKGNATKLVLTALGCEQTSIVYPVEDHAAGTAAELRTALVVLALNTLKN